LLKPLATAGAPNDLKVRKSFNSVAEQQYNNIKHARGERERVIVIHAALDLSIRVRT